MPNDKLNFVNPLQGTDSQEDFSRGNTLPLVCTPFSMTAWTMQTGSGRWAFRWRDSRIEGIRATHQPSPWMGDHGQFCIMPQTGPRLVGERERAASYDRNTLIVKPGYLRVDLPRYGCRMELTPTERCARMRLSFEDARFFRLIVDCASPGGTLNYVAAKNMLQGVARANDGGVPDNFGMSFVIRPRGGRVGAFSLFPDAEAGRNGKHPHPVLGALEFDNHERGAVEFDIATSYISSEQAIFNLESEIGDLSFEEIRQRAEAQWEERLRSIDIRTDDEELASTFYSCLYRVFTFPQKLHEPAEGGGVHHFSPYNGKVCEGELYAGHGFWDTYRTTYPLFALICPEDYASMLRGWINACKEGGWYPRWPSPGYRLCMLSTHVDVVFADAFAKNITGVDYAEAYEGLRKNAFVDPKLDLGYGRPGLSDYIKHGYLPADRYHASVAATLDNAHCDFGLSVLAEGLGRHEEAATLTRRSMFYRNLFDPSVGLMRGRLEDGTWLDPFREFEWGGPYVEGGAWQTSWGVPHDPQGLIALHGGEKPFTDKLEEMLRLPAKFEAGSYGMEIHEMTEMAMAQFGQYAHSNQPVHNALFLFAAAGRPQLMEHWVRRILTEYYNSGPGGFPGDEDNGEMSAWFVLSALGLFPHCPGKAEYTLIYPLVESAVIRLQNDHLLEITAESIVDESGGVCRQSGQYISHEELIGLDRLEIGSVIPDHAENPASAVLSYRVGE